MIESLRQFENCQTKHSTSNPIKHRFYLHLSSFHLNFDITQFANHQVNEEENKKKLHQITSPVFYLFQRKNKKNIINKTMGKKKPSTTLHSVNPQKSRIRIQQQTPNIIKKTKFLTTTKSIPFSPTDTHNNKKKQNPKKGNNEYQTSGPPPETGMTVGRISHPHNQQRGRRRR